MERIVLSLIALAAAGLTIQADDRGRLEAVYFLKPLTMGTIILIAALGEGPLLAGYKAFILAGLTSSLAGDAFMMLRRKRFKEGLAAFLAAHVFYILAFRGFPSRDISYGTLLPFALFGILAFCLLAPGLGKLKVPVFIYIAAIVGSAWLAADRFVFAGGTKPGLAFWGAVLFLVSDSVLAFNRFRKPFSRAQMIILGTYFPAQLLIALSV